ncbi:hypothetical protein B0J14DRAFT_700932 [Halenospora varia]|nr:hypothetical protein B0J14DRAFT_700932 [Halenospora varia]
MNCLSRQESHRRDTTNEAALYVVQVGSTHNVESESNGLLLLAKVKTLMRTIFLGQWFDFDFEPVAISDARSDNSLAPEGSSSEANTVSLLKENSIPDATGITRLLRDFSISDWEGQNLIINLDLEPGPQICNHEAEAPQDEDSRTNGSSSNAPQSSTLPNTLGTTPVHVVVDESGTQCESASLDTSPRPCPTDPPDGRTSQIPDFVQIGRDLYEATRLRPDETLKTEWNDVWRKVLNRRLLTLRLGQDLVTNVRFSMVGKLPKEEHMKPTILLICPGSESQRKRLQKKLSSFIETTIPSRVGFKISAGDLRRSSGSANNACCEGGAPSLASLVDAQWGQVCLMGMMARFRDESERFSTIGGFIIVGNCTYALTTAHSLFSDPDDYNNISMLRSLGFDIIQDSSGEDIRERILAVEEAKALAHSQQREGKTPDPPVPAQGSSLRQLEPFGSIDKYKWSGNHGNDKELSQDWLTIDVTQESPCLNKFWRPGSSDHTDVQDFIKERDLVDGEVIVCAGMTGCILGILNADPCSIVYGSMVYNVYSIALEAPLSDGDSGSWVIKEGKVCGMIFVRLGGLPWGYMLPIELIIDSIAKAYSTNTTRPQVRISNKE